MGSRGSLACTYFRGWGPNSGHPAKAPRLPTWGQGTGVYWPAAAPHRGRRGGCYGEVSASPSCPEEKPTVPSVSCFLGFVP